MTIHPDLTSQAFYDPDATEEIQFLDYRILFGPTRSGWLSFVVRQGQRPIIVLANDRHTLLEHSRQLVEQRVHAKR